MLGGIDSRRGKVSALHLDKLRKKLKIRAPIIYSSTLSMPFAAEATKEALVNLEAFS